MARRINRLRLLRLFGVIIRLWPAQVIYLQRAFPLSARRVPLSETTPACPSTGRPVEPWNEKHETISRFFPSIAERSSVGWGSTNGVSLAEGKVRRHDAKITEMSSCREDRHAQPEAGSPAEFTIDLLQIVASLFRSWPVSG